MERFTAGDSGTSSILLDLIRASELSPVERLLLLEVAVGGSTATNAELSARLGIGARHVQRTLHTLTEKGFLRSQMLFSGRVRALTLGDAATRLSPPTLWMSPPDMEGAPHDDADPDRRDVPPAREDAPHALDVAPYAGQEALPTFTASPTHALPRAPAESRSTALVLVGGIDINTTTTQPALNPEGAKSSTVRPREAGDDERLALLEEAGVALTVAVVGALEREGWTREEVADLIAYAQNAEGVQNVHGLIVARLKSGVRAVPRKKARESGTTAGQDRRQPEPQIGRNEKKVAPSPEEGADWMSLKAALGRPLAKRGGESGAAVLR